MPGRVAVALLLSSLGASVALAQEGEEDLGPAPEPALPPTEDDARRPLTEGIDPTRLDVERLPPEAIEITRDLYSHGFFAEAGVGGRGFIGGLADIANPGPYASVGFGLEIFRFLLVRVSFEMSIHSTRAPAPPSPTVFEVLGAFAEARIQLNFTSWLALWLGGEIGGVITTGDVLPAYGVQDADEVGIAYGGLGGFDFHMKSRHTSLGLSAGARHYPSLSAFDGSQTIGVAGTAYLRHVF